jgi:hypothetical protein
MKMFMIKEYSMSPGLVFVLVALAGSSQELPNEAKQAAIPSTNPPAPAVQAPARQASDISRRVEETRLACIQSRRLICGRILKVLPDGLVVDSGYTNLIREPLKSSWLIPGTVTATHAVNLVESSQPDSVCVGQVFIANAPISKSAKPKLYDYVVLEGFPIGQCTYTSVGDLQRTVRKFTCKIANAVNWKLEQESIQK